MKPDAEGPVDLLFIYPPWPVLADRAFLQNSLPPLGILSIAAYLEDLGYRVGVCDVHGEKLSDHDLRDRLHEYRPKFIGISMLTNMCIPAHAIARICREEMPDATIFVGGVHAEALPNQVLRNACIDAVIRGDGEEATREIVEGVPYAEIAGLSYRIGSRLVYNPPRKLEMNLDRYPLPAYHLINFKNYFPAVGSYRNLPAINMLMTRGCPGRCTFCNSARTTLRARSPARVVAQIKHLHETYGIRQIQFYDDTFTVLKKHCLEFCRLLSEAELDVTWTAYIRGDCFSEDMAKAMKQAGCHQVLVGIETGNREIAKRIGKPIDRERYKQAVQIAHDHGLEVRGSFIIGNLDETWETMQDTLDFAIELDIDLFQLSISTPYPGTALHNEAVAKGILIDYDWYNYGQGRVLINQPQISAEEIYRFERHAFRKFYLRPKSIYRMVKRMSSFRQIRDNYFATIIFLFGLHRGQSNRKWDCWLRLNEADYLDLQLDNDDGKLRLTHELRQQAEFV